MKLWHAPTGNLVRGHVLDVSVAPFTRALKDLDSRLYVRWNPNKIRGWGCWEIRRKPSQQVAVHQGTHEGVSYYKLKFIELNDVHHVLDCAFLNYDAIRKLKEMDVMQKVKEAGYASLDDYMEAKASEHKARTLEQASKELGYAVKHNRSAMQDLYEMVNSGMPLGQILTSISWS